MLTEDYCSQEVVKLLKEKGFKIKQYYNSLINMWQDTKVTHQMAMKWLRNVHKLHIEISVDVNDKHCFYASIYYNGEECWEEKEYYPDGVTTYEEAVEAALKYSLENLI